MQPRPPRSYLHALADLPDVIAPISMCIPFLIPG